MKGKYLFMRTLIKVKVKAKVPWHYTNMLKKRKTPKIPALEMERGSLSWEYERRETLGTGITVGLSYRPSHKASGSQYYKPYYTNLI